MKNRSIASLVMRLALLAAVTICPVTPPAQAQNSTTRQGTPRAKPSKPQAQSSTDTATAITTKPFAYKQTRQRKLMLYAELPPNWQPKDQRPAVVYFFGGGWKSGTVDQFMPQARYFASRGMVAIRVDYRVKNRDGVTPLDCVRDARSAMRWVRARAGELGVDPDRIVSSGGSAGGHLAACVYFSNGVDDPGDDLSVSPHPNAMVLYNPALNLLALDSERSAQLTKIIDKEAQKRISPTLHLTKAIPPTLILDGTADFLNGQIREFVEKGLHLGAPVEVFWAPDAKHGFFNRPPWLEPTTKRVDDFFQAIGYLSADPKVPLPKSPPKKRDGRK